MLIIFEMANNHNGDVETGLKIIEEIAMIDTVFAKAIKFQFRNLETFIRKDAVQTKHVKRFQETKLSKEDFDKMINAASKKGMKTIATCFDEESIDNTEHIDILKVASCSNTDWPLLERVADVGKPVIISTGGLDINGVDNIVSFFRHKDVDFSLLHCVSIYPMNNSDAGFGFMKTMIKRYPGVKIGYSGHEVKDNFLPTIISIAAGAQIIERHVGIDNLNDYSMCIEGANELVACIETITSMADDKIVTPEEKGNLNSLQRGAFAKKEITKSEGINKDNVYYAFPCLEGQTVSGDIGRYRTNIKATKDYKIDDPIYDDEADYNSTGEIRRYTHIALGMVNEAGINIGNTYNAEISCHYGIDNFEKVGAFIISLINREYCKKLIILFAGQAHPAHMHKAKEETFQILSGSMVLTVNEKHYELETGDIMLVERYQEHSFFTDTGVIFEEISTTHVSGDSFYVDKDIYKLDPLERKIQIEKL